MSDKLQFVATLLRERLLRFGADRGDKLKLVGLIARSSGEA